MSNDKVTVGLTNGAYSAMEDLMKLGWFQDQIAAAKFAFGIAIKHDCKPADLKGAGTIWNVGSFDPDGNVKTLMRELFGEEDAPYRAAESLIDQGFSLIRSRFKENPNAELTDFMAD